MTDVRPYLEKFWSESYDCWALVRDFYLQEFGVKLPVVMVDATNPREVLREFEYTPIRASFDVIEEPQEGCVVEMGTQGRPHHVGVWIDGRVLHNHYRGGVVLEPRPQFDILAYYALRNPPTLAV